MSISLILPYWQRQDAANKALLLLDSVYKNLDLEVVIVDDGNKVPFVLPEINLSVKIISLPEKSGPKCPVTAWNAGVAAATYDIVVLSCIEILHEKPVLAAMQDTLEALGPKGYVLAAAWCPESAGWHCHSTVKTPRNPQGTGIAFCGMLYKSLYNEAGGFNEAYREGAGYEDNDFINRLLKARARFVICDDLVVTHPKTGATIEWPIGGFERNEKLFYSLWPEELPEPPGITFVCVNVGDYCERGAEYVNKLFDMAARNLHPRIKAKFVCLTDNPEGLNKGIQVLEPLHYVKGWWNKLYLFKEGLFPKGERIVYFDLDTLIVGSLDEIVAYDGDFAILSDFYAPDRFAPAAMLWRAGEHTDIWECWKHAGFPNTDKLGDLWWINELYSGTIFDALIDRLQYLYPNKFVSYKKDCDFGPVKDSSVICFHGIPRPHEVEGWVQDVWKINGVTLNNIKLINNTNLSKVKENIYSSSIRNLSWIDGMKEERNWPVCIVGGGPSLKKDIERIRTAQENYAHIMALNGAGNFLIENGIVPNSVVVIDARPENVKFVQNGQANRYYLASQCDPSLFDAVGNFCTLFHIDIPYLGSYVPGERPIQAIGGGSTVGLTAMSLAYVLGFRTMHLYGYDSSYADSQHHAYEQKQNDEEVKITAHVGGKDFTTTACMVMQVNQFQELATQLRALGCTIAVHGEGLLPTVAWEMLKRSS